MFSPMVSAPFTCWPGVCLGARALYWSISDRALAWAWQRAGVQISYGYSPDEINGAAVSFYEWAVANGQWHPAGSGYVAQPGDVAVYGL
jgi:hypothetical protein